MHAPMNGPDLLDVRTYLKSLDLIYGCTTTITMAYVGKPFEPRWKLTLTSVAEGSLPFGEPPSVTLEQEHSALTGQHLGSTLYNMCCLHDHALGKRWSTLEEKKE